MSDADAISYLNRMVVSVIYNESFRTQLSELSSPLHHPRQLRGVASGAPRHTGTRCADHKVCHRLVVQCRMHAI